jgi:hypothetical protein
LAQAEEDLAVKAKARFNPSSSSANRNVARRLNQMEGDMEAKARAWVGPSKSTNTTTTKRSNRQEEDDAAKAKARGSPSWCPQLGIYFCGI